MADPEEILVRCLDREPSQWAAALDQACTEHPEHADDLRRRFLIINGFGADAAESAAIPEQLDGFRILDRLGGGGMGVVYRAEQGNLGRQVALKLIRPEHLRMPAAKRRFQREVAAVARLQHPGVVAVHTVGEDQGFPYFTMNLVAGKSLSEIVTALTDRTPRSLAAADLLRLVRGDAEAPSADASAKAKESGPDAPGSWVDICIRITAEVARALAHAHEQNLLHRDVKPSNVMVTPEGHAVLLDFGLAGLLAPQDESRLTRTGTPIGTTAYMAPEQIEGFGSLRPTADVYGLGVTLYELLTLTPPFEEDSVATTQFAILEGRVDPPRSRNRAIPEDVQTVCLKAMERRPADRYQDARQFAEDLDRLLARTSIVARAPGAWQRVKRFARSRPALSTGLGFAFLILTVFPTVLWVLASNHAERLAEHVDRERTAKEGLARALQAEQTARGRADTAERIAIKARDFANSNAEELHDVVEFLSDIFDQSGPSKNGGKVLSGRDLVERATARLEKSLGNRPASRARIDLALSKVYGGLGLYEIATRHASASSAYFETHLAPHNRYLFAESLRLQALCVAQHQGAQASLKFSRRAVTVAEACHPVGHPQLARYYGDLGMALALCGEFSEAETMLEKVPEPSPATQREASAGATDKSSAPLIRAVLHASLGNGLIAHGQLDAAAAHLAKAIPVLITNEDVLLDFRGGRALQDLAHIRKVQKQRPAAKNLLTRAHRVLKKSRGADDHLTLGAESELLHFRNNSGERTAALVKRLGEVARSLRGNLDAAHPLTIRACAYQVRALLTLGRAAEALKLCKEFDLVANAQKMLSVQHRLLASILVSKSICHASLGQGRESMEALGLSLKVQRKVEPIRSPTLLRFLLGHASMAVQVREYPTARESLADALDRVRDHAVWIQPPNRKLARREVGIAALQSLLQIERLDHDPEAAAEVEARLRARKKKLDAKKIQ